MRTPLLEDLERVAKQIISRQKDVDKLIASLCYLKEHPIFKQPAEGDSKIGAFFWGTDAIKRIEALITEAKKAQPITKQSLSMKPS